MMKYKVKIKQCTRKGNKEKQIKNRNIERICKDKIELIYRERSYIRKSLKVEETEIFALKLIR